MTQSLLFGVSPIILANSGTPPIAASASTTEINFVPVTVPAGVMGANGRIVVDLLYLCTGTTAAKSFKVRLSTSSGDTTTGFLFVNRSTPTTVLSAQAYQRSVWNSNSASAQIAVDPTVNTTMESIASTSTGAINTANVSYININGNVGNAADTIRLMAYTVLLYLGV